MMKINESSEKHFILIGFSEYPRAEFILSLFASGFYIMTLTGNAAIILVSILDSRLHTPMYFFLRNLSFLDIFFTTSIVLQMLVNMWGNNKISYVGCIVQLIVSSALGCTECVLLAVMSIDRYVAVCWPLRYTTIMHPRICHLLAAISWIWGLGHSLLQSSLAIVLPRCGHRRVDHFFCEVLIIIKLSCVDTRPTEAKMFAPRLLILIVPVVVILTSYACIARAVIRMKSAEGRRKAFGTCASHLMVVFVFYGTIMFMYLQPKNNYSQNQGKALSFFYTIVAPSTNPLIYTLRNKDVKRAIRKIVWKDSTED
ncbi:LOW QUALITY PROTEIN: putative olfactory receptor 2W6 [Suncus etruscus]|uniref:LOW QUALITY PROTEIN: putative olfactory receptor 2W6 n=1 Tax=Suncus etruscus TaxID=109475 RepID=UPI00210F7183|nr:LOW QUALITY PROTEIN: putative olfactory receptor 2W6 [Suncus etruscus]